MSYTCWQNEAPCENHQTDVNGNRGAVFPIREVAHGGIVICFCRRFLGGLAVTHVHTHVHIHRFIISVGKRIRNGGEKESCRECGTGSSLPHEGGASILLRTGKSKKKR